MSNIQRYCVDWNGEGLLVVEVNHDVLTEEELREINAFWYNAEERLEEQDGNALYAILTLLTAECFHLCFRGCFSASMLIDEFERGVEGWPRMDGSAGITIISCDEPDFFTSDMTVIKWEVGNGTPQVNR